MAAVSISGRGNMLPVRRTTSSSSSRGQALPALRGMVGSMQGRSAQQVRAGFNPAQEQAFKQWTGTVAKAGQRPTGERVLGTQPGWQEQSAWDENRRNLNTSYAGGLASNERALDRMRQGFAGEERQFQEGFDDVRERVPFAAQRKGMLRSGVYGRQLQDVAMSRESGLRDMLMRRGQGLDELHGQRADLTRRRDSGLAGVARSEQLRRAQLAALLGR